MLKSYLVCLVALGEIVGVYGGHLPKEYRSKFSVCVEVADAAIRQGVDVYLTVAVAREESAFTNPTEGKAKGPLQIIPAYHCPDADGVVRRSSNKGVSRTCDLVTEGVLTLEYFLSKYSTEAEALCHYNSGTVCLPGGRQYSRRVLKYRRYIRAMVTEVPYECDY